MTNIQLRGCCSGVDTYHGEMDLGDSGGRVKRVGIRKWRLKREDLGTDCIGHRLTDF